MIIKGFLGSLVAALFTAYAIEEVPKVEWGRKMVNEILPRAYLYIKNNGRDWQDYQKDLLYFENAVCDSFPSLFNDC